MFIRYCRWLALVIISVLLSTTDAIAPCKVQMPEACWNQTQFNQINTVNQTYYCEQATLLIVQASICYTACGFTAPSNITSQRTQIDSFCNSASAGKCTSVTSLYSAYVACYDSIGGVDAGIQALIKQFNAKNSTDFPCSQLQTARSCQLPYRTGSCSYLVDLDRLFIAVNPDILLGLGICGSEAVAALVPLITRTDGCSPGLSSTIESQCNIACDLANNATDPKTFCALLQKQADCIYGLSAGCTSAQAQYLLPRFDSYAIANYFLGCSVKIKNTIVQARLQNGCNYISQINTCFFYDYPPNLNSIVFDLLHQLFNRDTPVVTFCRNLVNSSAAISNCSMSFATCMTPLSGLYQKPSVYNDSFAPSMGVYPLNVWGVTSIFKWLGSMPTCNGILWTDRICLPPPTTTTTTTTVQPPTTTTTASTPVAGSTTSRESRPTPSVASTSVQPTPAGSAVNGTPPQMSSSTTAGFVQPGGGSSATLIVIGHSDGSGQKTTTKSSNAVGGIQQAVKSSGTRNMMSFFILVCCAILSLHL